MSIAVTARRNVVVGLLATGGAALVAATAARAADGAEDPLAKLFGGSFDLTAHDGRRVSDRDFRGSYMLIMFGFTRCPDICPTDLTIMTEALDLLGPAGAAVQPIFITLDPARDDLSVLNAYRRSFHPRFLFLRGTENETQAVAKAFKVHRRKYVSTSGEADDYGIDHGSLKYLIGPGGVFKTIIPHGAPADRVAEVIRKYLV